MKKNEAQIRKARKAKYTPEFYLSLKAKEKLKWREVPFCCHWCGASFYVEHIKPKALPVNCSPECRMKAFDPSVGKTLSRKVANLDKVRIKNMLLAGKTAPDIAKTLGISLVTVHKFVKRFLGLSAFGRMIENGKKRRKYGQSLARSNKNRKA